MPVNCFRCQQPITETRHAMIEKGDIRHISCPILPTDTLASIDGALKEMMNLNLRDLILQVKNELKSEFERTKRHQSDQIDRIFENTVKLIKYVCAINDAVKLGNAEIKQEIKDTRVLLGRLVSMLIERNTKAKPKSSKKPV